MLLKDSKQFSCKTVLIVDDCDIVCEVFKEALVPLVSELDVARDGAEALARIMERDFDIILLDVEMPGMNGMDFFRHLNNLKPHLAGRVIFITGDIETPETRMFILKTGCRYLDKPFMIRDLFNVMAGS